MPPPRPMRGISVWSTPGVRSRGPLDGSLVVSKARGKAPRSFLILLVALCLGSIVALLVSSRSSVSLSARRLALSSWTLPFWSAPGIRPRPTAAQSGLVAEREEMASVCMPRLKGYPGWPQGGSERAPGNVTKDQYCEPYWGNGFEPPATVWGSPPEGAFREPDIATARALAAEARAQGTNLTLPECLRGAGTTSSGAGSGWGPGGKPGAPTGGVVAAKQRRVKAGEAEDGSAIEVSGGWLRCHRNPTLGSSVCEGSMVGVYPSRMAMSQGGEVLGDAIRFRDEKLEYPRCAPGAVEIAVGPSSSQGQSLEGIKGAPRREEGVTKEGSESGGEGQGGEGSGERGEKLPDDFGKRFYPEHGIQEWESLLSSVRSVPSIQCAQLDDRPTLIVMRFEYVNLYHTSTDWFNAFHAAVVAGLRVRPQVLFLDGHAQGNLDSSWVTMFNGYQWVKLYDVGERAMCFRHAIFVPLGYHSPIFRAYGNPGEGRRSCVGDKEILASANPRGETTAVTEFAEFTVKSHGVQIDPGSWAPQEWRAAERRRRVTGVPAETQGTRSQSQSQSQSQTESEHAVWDRLRFGTGPVRVLFIRRDPAYVHPRQADPGAVNTRMGSQEDFIKALKAWTVTRGTWSLVDRLESEEREERMRGVRKEGEGGKEGTASGAAGLSLTSQRLTAALRVAEKYVSGQPTGGGHTDWLNPNANAPPDGTQRLVYLLNGTMVQWTLSQQLEAVQWADILVGPHGAGLTHVTYMRPGSALIEIRPPDDERDFYELLARWRGHRYTRVHSAVVEDVQRAIVSLLGESMR